MYYVVTILLWFGVVNSSHPKLEVWILLCNACRTYSLNGWSTFTIQSSCCGVNTFMPSLSCRKLSQADAEVGLQWSQSGIPRWWEEEIFWSSGTICTHLLICQHTREQDRNGHSIIGIDIPLPTSQRDMGCHEAGKSRHAHPARSPPPWVPLL